MKRDLKRVIGEGKFVLTGGLVVARYRLAFVAEVIGFTVLSAKLCVEDFQQALSRPEAFHFLAIATDHSWNQQRAYPDG